LVGVEDYAAQVMLLTQDVVIGWEGQPTLWAFDMVKHRFLFQKDDVRATVVKLNLDGESILVGHLDGTVGCYPLADGEIRWASRLHEGWVSNLITCPELSLIVTSGSDGLLCLVLF
jgi:WD40 repeat protein